MPIDAAEDRYRDALAFAHCAYTGDELGITVVITNADCAALHLELCRLTMIALARPACTDPLAFIDSLFDEISNGWPSQGVP